jgi:hypothetical protein
MEWVLNQKQEECKTYATTKVLFIVLLFLCPRVKWWSGVAEGGVGLSVNLRWCGFWPVEPRFLGCAAASFCTTVAMSPDVNPPRKQEANSRRREGSERSTSKRCSKREALICEMQKQMKSLALPITTYP